MRKAFYSTIAGLALLTSANAAIDTTLVDDTQLALEGLSSSATSLFEGVVPVVLAAVGIGILVAMVKFIKKR